MKIVAGTRTTIARECGNSVMCRVCVCVLITPPPPPVRVASAYQRALDCLRRRQYRHVVSLCTQFLSQSGVLALRPEATLLRATFYLLRGEGHRAMDDFDSLLQMADADKRVRSAVPRERSDAT